MRGVNELQFDKATKDMLGKLINLWMQQVNCGLFGGLEGNIEGIDSWQQEVEEQQVQLGLVTQLSLDRLDAPMLFSLYMALKV